MAELDLFYSDEDRHRVILLEQALASAGVAVALHTQAFEPVSDPVLGVLSEHAEPWMITQAKSCASRLIWLRLDHSEMPCAARKSLALQNWPGRSADLAISELARSLTANSAETTGDSPSSMQSERSSSRRTRTFQESDTPGRVAPGVGAASPDSGPRPLVVLAWIVGLIIAFALLLSVLPEPSERRLVDEAAEAQAADAVDHGRASAAVAPQTAETARPPVRPGTQPNQLDSVSITVYESDADVESHADVESDAETGNEAKSGVLRPTPLVTQPSTPPVTRPLTGPTAGVVPDSPNIVAHESPLAETDANEAALFDAGVCMALAETDTEAAMDVLLTLSGWDRLLCRAAIEQAAGQPDVAGSLVRLCLAPTQSALTAWLAQRYGGEAPTAACLPGALD
ncbi:MAG: hypothetical protein NXH85_11325 [Pseudomonadaceae bacterium]|nr:hypothetical protein [Pseudomonadaceae bacterium]